MKFDLCDYLERQIQWSEATFGPGEHYGRNVDHILKELREVIQEPRSLEEWVDIVMIATDGAMRAGFNPGQIARQLEAKLEINKGRTWPDWRTQDPTKAIEHIKPGEPAPEPKRRRHLTPGLGYMVECGTCHHKHEIFPYSRSHRADDGKSVSIGWKPFQRFRCPSPLCMEDAIYQIVGMYLFVRWVRPSTEAEQAVDPVEFNLYNELTTGNINTIIQGADDETTAAGVSGGNADGIVLPATEASGGGADDSGD